MYIDILMPKSVLLLSLLFITRLATSQQQALFRIEEKGKPVISIVQALRLYHPFSTGATILKKALPLLDRTVYMALLTAAVNILLNRRLIALLIL
jgi:hypothetical protein